MVSFPYSYYRCPCAEERQDAHRVGPGMAVGGNGGDATGGAGMDEEDVEDTNETFDPGNPRSNYSLYPLDSLMWCSDCADIRCSRCTLEEIVCWYCPNCLFEVPSSTVRQEGSRCTRNCFDCPECTGPLTINSLDPDPNGTAGPYILLCNHCNWTSLDVGLKFSTPRYVYNQLQQQSGGGGNAGSKSTQRLHSRVLETVPEPGPTTASDAAHRDSSRDASPNPADARKTQDPVSRFNALKAFYKAQLNSAYPNDGLYNSDFSYSSPNHISRVLAMYSSARSGSKVGAGAKATAMREAGDVSEGLQMFSPEADVRRVAKLKGQGWSGTASAAQHWTQQGVAATAGGVGVHLLSDLKPVPTLLHTKRSSRCRGCKHILVKPDAKIGSTRFRIKLAAAEHVPSMSLRPLTVSGQPVGGTGEDGAPVSLDLQALPPSRTLQFLLKVTNPTFDTVIRMTLATPQETPGKPDGRGGSRVTILCPQFEIGANTDVWDEALKGGGTGGIGAGGGGGGGSGGAGAGSGAAGQVAEAGKVWERGGNWTSVVVEVVPKRLQKKTEELDEDEDVLEIPIFVRLEYDPRAEDATTAAAEDKKKKREMSYWTVLGVGRIATESGAGTVGT